MPTSNKLRPISTTLLVFCCISISSASSLLKDSYPPSITAAELLHRRGYQAKELFINTTSGYVLRITRGRNPLIENGHLESKDPILFVHGTKSTANNFLVNSFDVEPKDFTNFDFSSQASLDELNEALAKEPSAKSLPLLALNCGHEVWLIDRRGRPGSQYLVGDSKSIRTMPSLGQSSLAGLISAPLFAQQVALTYDRKFWNFSLDEQADKDFPEMVEFVLNNSPYASKVSVVGHSAGGAIALMALSLHPELSAKISACIVWSPAYAKGNDNEDPEIGDKENFIGPIPAPFSTNLYQAMRMLICSPPQAWTRCEQEDDSALGDSGGQEPMKPQFYAANEFSTSSHELAQVDQASRFAPDRTMHKFDFGPDGNRAAYGQSTPPAYDLSVLSNFSGISFYAAATDLRVTPADVQMIRDQLEVPSQFHLINTTFNHNGYFFHVDAPTLAVIPSMRELEILAEGS